MHSRYLVLINLKTAEFFILCHISLLQVTKMGTTEKSADISVDIPNECSPQNVGSTELIIADDKSSSEDCMPTVNRWFKTKAQQIFRKKTLYKRLPILNWLPKYNSEDAVGDLVAGFTVGLTVIPQALAYAGIAGLPAAYGLYGSFLGCFVYIFLGSCKDVPMGPTAIASLLTFQAAEGNWQKSVLLCFLSGLVELLMGIFGLGFLIDFVSGPVSSGFTSAVALIILTSQVKDIFGVKASGSTFINTWLSIFEDIHNIRLGDTIMGLICIIVLLGMRLLVRVNIGPKDDSEKSLCQKIITKFIWLIGTARNAVLVVTCGAIGAIFIDSGVFKLIGEIPAGLPDFAPPPFSITPTGNSTEEKALSFGDMVSDLGSGIAVVPLIALLEDIAVCKAFSNGKSVDATQELLAIGASNIANSFVSGYPGSGALARGAVNNASGVRTPLGNLYTGMLVILALLFLTPYFSFIPKAALAAVIIAAVVFMVEVRVVKPMWRSKKTDLIPGFAAFIACLALPLEIGILIGIGLNILFILYHAARPKLRLEFLTTQDNHKYLMLTPDRCLIFPSVDFVRNTINKHGLRSTLPVVIDCTHIYGADFTAAKAISTLINDFKERNQLIFFYNVKPSVVQVFEGAQLKDLKLHYDFDALEMAISANDKQ